MSKKIICAVALGGCGLSLNALADVEVAPNTTVGSQLFADVSHISNDQAGIPVAPDGTGFDVKRFYLIVDHIFNDVWSANLTTDAQYISSPSVSVTTAPVAAGAKPVTVTTSTTNSGAVTEVFIKKLYLQAKFDDAFVLHAGSYNMPWTTFVEGLYGYRWIEKVTTDRLGFANTADWGLHATGSFGPTGINYALSAVNGGGFKNPSRSKDIDFEGQVNYVSPIGVTLGVGAYAGHLGQVVAANQDFDKHTATRLDSAIGYQLAGLRVGGEYYVARNYKTVNSVTAGAFGTSAVIATSITTIVPDDKSEAGPSSPPTRSSISIRCSPGSTTPRSAWTIFLV